MYRLSPQFGLVTFILFNQNMYNATDIHKFIYLYAHYVCVCVCVEWGLSELNTSVLSYMRQLYSFLLFVYFSKKVVPP